MSTSLQTPHERARNMLNLVFQRMQDPGTGVSIAVAMGVSEPTVSRIKNDRLEEVLLFLACAGFRIVPSDHAVVDRKAHEALVYLTTKALADPDTAVRLLASEE